MLRIMKANGSPAPIFETDEDRSYYLVRLAAHPLAEGNSQLDDERAGQVTGQVTGQVAGQADSWLVKVLQACQSMPLKSAEIQQLTGIRHRETFQRNYLDHLIEERLIERTIPDKPTSSKQKYRITDKGKRFLEER